MRNGLILYNSTEIEKLRLAGKLAAQALKHVCDRIEIGMKTIDIDNMFHKFLHGTGGKAACKGYHGFPANLCVSVNDEACHGIPGSRQIKDGDIVSVDLVVELDGFHGDTCWTTGVGNISTLHSNLISTSHDALLKGIAAVQQNALISVIGQAIEASVLNTGFSIVKDYCGHGVGRKMHEHPLILHYNHSTSHRFINGMCFTIEPILTTGKGKTYVDKDNWTVLTSDRAYSAQFEHTMAIVDGKVEIFTVA